MRASVGRRMPIFIIMLILAASSGAAADGTFGARWSIDTFADAAVNVWKNSPQARQPLELALIGEGLSVPVRSASITISSGMSSASQLTESTGDRGDAEKVSAKLPITDRISLNAAYDLNKSSGSLKLSYTLPHTWLAGSDEGIAQRLFGHSGASEDAKVSTDMARMKLDASESSIKLKAQKAYIGALKSQKNRETAEEEWRLAQTALEIATKRCQVGLSTERDVEQAELSVLDAEIALVKAENEERWARRELSKLAGVDMLEAELEDLPQFSLDMPSLDVMIEAAFESDVELAQAELGLDSSIRELEAIRSLLPTVSAEVQFPSGSSVPKFVASATWSISLSRSLEAQKAEINVDQKRQSVTERREALAENVERSLEQLHVSVWSAAKWVKQLEQSQESYDTALKSYEDGELLLVDLERAQLNLKKARNSYIANWYGVWELWYTLANTCRVEDLGMGNR